MISHPLSDFRRSYYMESARKIFKRKTAAYARKMDVTYGRITIREQKTRWGSCTSEGNLNFNWRLIFAPEEVVDYIVVHELAHRKEMNHSRAFYDVVASVLPDYKVQEKWLKENGEKCFIRYLKQLPLIMDRNLRTLKEWRRQRAEKEAE